MRGINKCRSWIWSASRSKWWFGWSAIATMSRSSRAKSTRVDRWPLVPLSTVPQSWTHFQIILARATISSYWPRHRLYFKVKVYLCKGQKPGYVDHQAFFTASRANSNKMVNRQHQEQKSIQVGARLHFLPTWRTWPYRQQVIWNLQPMQQPRPIRPPIEMEVILKQLQQQPPRPRAHPHPWQIWRH